MRIIIAIRVIKEGPAVGIRVMEVIRVLRDIRVIRNIRVIRVIRVNCLLPLILPLQHQLLHYSYSCYYST